GRPSGILRTSFGRLRSLRMTPILKKGHSEAEGRRISENTVLWEILRSLTLPQDDTYAYAPSG
ncbi:MAG: hypothetical protein U9Q08_05070, partial [Candidatus Omnitrophota bacterium]|nr:hypothetical protein [Candidatus Omnitrophota bacterium]